MNFFSKIRSSANEFFNLRSLVVTGMLIGLYVAIHFTCTVPLSPTLQIRFGFVALALIGALYGPTVGAVAGGICDLLALIRSTGPFTPWYTVIYIIMGFIFGICLYQNKNKILATVSSSALTVVICDTILGTIALLILYPQPLFPMFWGRLIKSAIMLPIELVLVFFVLTLVEHKEIKRILKRS